MELRTPDQLAVDVRAPSPDLFFNVLRDSIEDLITRRWPGLSYQLLIPCPTCRPRRAAAAVVSSRLKFLLGYRERGGTHAPCHECFVDWDISELLTGFAQPDLPLQLELERLHDQVADVGSGVKRAKEESIDWKRYAAETADSMRRVMRAVSSEITDCPRLFTLTDENPAGARRLKIFQRHYRLVLVVRTPRSLAPMGCRQLFPGPAQGLATPHRPICDSGFQGPAACRAHRRRQRWEWFLTDEQLQHAQYELKLMTTLVADLPDSDNRRPTRIHSPRIRKSAHSG